MTTSDDQADKEHLTLTHMDEDVIFYHQNDERVFFEWLSRISCVKNYTSEHDRGLVVYLRRAPGEDELRELLAFCKRYRVNMKQLAKFENNINRHWFRDPKKYWYRAIFLAKS